MQIELRSVNELTPYAHNPRHNDGAVAAVARSLATFGFRQPIVVDSAGMIVVGHTRWKAALQLGLTQVPVHVARDLSAAQARAYRLADNQTATLSSWDLDLLPAELAGLQIDGFDLTTLGFDDTRLSELLAGIDEVLALTDEDEVPAPPERAVTRRGELIQLGQHRLLCGDSAEAADVDKLVGGEPVDLVNTDPPYNVRVEPRSNNAIAAGLSSFPPASGGPNTGGRKGGGRGQAKSSARAGAVVAGGAGAIAGVGARAGAGVSAGADAAGGAHAGVGASADALAGNAATSGGGGGGMHHQGLDLARHPGKARPTTRVLRAKDRPLVNDFVSDAEFARLLRLWLGNLARVLRPGGSFYLWGGYANCASYPPALAASGLYFSQALIWVKEHPVLTRKDFMGNHEWCFYGWKEGAGHKFYGPANISDTWSVKKVSPQSMVHLTEKPVELARRALEYSSRPGARVLDLFGGSGSTLIAAQQTQRRALLMELDPLYCDVIVARWEQFTGQKVRRQ